MTQLYEVEKICRGDTEHPWVPVASGGAESVPWYTANCWLSCTSLEVFQEFLQDFVDFATQKITVQENNDSFWEEFAFLRLLTKGGREVEDGCIGRLWYLCLHHVCLYELTKCQARMSSYSPVTESLPHEAHPSLPAPSMPPAIGYLMTFAQITFLPSGPRVSALSSYHILCKTKSHIKNIFLSISVIYTKTSAGPCGGRKTRW